jgi:hypothetical protein
MKGRITVCLAGEPQRLQERGSGTLFSSFNWFSIQKEHCLSVRVWQCEQFHLCANRPFQLNGTCTVSCKQRSRFAAGASRKLFPCKSRISMWKECLPRESLWQWRLIHSLKNARFRRNGQTLVAQGRKQCVRGRNSLHPVSLWEMSYLWKGILTTPEFFHVWGTSPFGRIAAFNWMEQEEIRMYENH